MKSLLKVSFLVGLASCFGANLSTASATALDAGITGTVTESIPTPVPGSQVITITGAFSSYSASLNLPQLTGGDLANYSFTLSGTASSYNGATDTAVYSNLTGTINGYGAVVQDIAVPTLTVVFNSTFTSADIIGNLYSTDPLGGIHPTGFPVGDFVDFNPADGATISATYTSNGVFGGGGSIVGSIMIPEPASMALLTAGLAGLGVIRRRRRG